MKNVLDMCKNMIGMPTADIDEMEEYGDDYDGRSSYSDRRSAEEYEARQQQRRTFNNNNKVVSIHPDINDMKVVVLSPTKYDEARIICDNLKACAPVIVKLDKLDRQEAQRIVDFISGACYTMDGNVQEIKDDVFLIAPSIVSIEESDEDKTVKSSSIFSKFVR